MPRKKKTRRKRAVSQGIADEFLPGLGNEIDIHNIPFVGMFQENPLGILVAVVMLFMMVAFFESNLPGNPFAAYTDWTGGVWTPFYNFSNYFVTLAFAFFPFALIMGYVVKADAEEHGETVQVGGRLGAIQGLAGRIKKPSFRRDFVSSGKRNPAANVPKGPGITSSGYAEGLRTGAYSGTFLGKKKTGPFTVADEPGR